MRIIMFVACLAYGQLSVAELPETYQSWSSAEKQAYLWEQKLAPSEWEALPALEGLGWGGILKSLKSLGSLGTSFDHESDELPEERTKLLHPYGSVVAIELVSAPDQPFTGIYQGALGLARLSLAGDPERMGFTPGMALKFFIDGQPSVNLHVMEKLSGQGEDKNFFAKTFTNILPEPEGFMFNAAVLFFGLFVENPTHLNISHLAKANASGEVVDQPLAPYQLFFEPTDDVQIDSDTASDFRLELGQFPVGTVLYRVWGAASKTEEPVYIGEIRTMTPIVASSYGDHELFFQHQR